MRVNDERKDAFKNPKASIEFIEFQGPMFIIRILQLSHNLAMARTKFLI